MLKFYKKCNVISGRSYQSLKFVHQLIQKHITDPPYSDLINFHNLELLQENINRRKANVDIKEIRSLLIALDNKELNNEGRMQILQQLKQKIWKIPNDTHPSVINIGESPKLLQKFNELPKFDFKPKPFNEISKKLNILRTEHLGNFSGYKSYYFMSTLAELEHALIQYTLDKLTKNKFRLVSVPDILPDSVIEGCGMDTKGERTQVYKLSGSNMCLSGTSEMALAGYFVGKILMKEDLPIKIAAVSRCFRAETSSLQEERGIYRVHQFTKAEMFSICRENQSEDMLELFKEIEIELYKELGLHFQLLDMPPNELGSPAYRKYDIEAWMPGRNMWGEISSCSNCTNYQAKRLNIKYDNDGVMQYAHTVNGTACAVPRLLIALLECNQNQNGTVRIPSVLQQYMRGKTDIVREKLLPELKLVKHIPNSF